MLRLAFDFIITWREARTRPNAYEDENCTTGTKAERIFSGAYARACCTACPHSWAATAAAATLLLPYTPSLRFTVLFAGL